MNKSLFLFLFIFLFTSFTLAQNNSATASAASPSATTSPDPRAQCAEQNHCGTDTACMAKCYGVPNPGSDAINKTTVCVANCLVKYAGDSSAIGNCQNDCS